MTTAQIYSEIAVMKIRLDDLTRALSANGSPIIPDLTADVRKIQSVVAAKYRIQVADMTSPKRPNRIAFPRMVAMRLSRDLVPMSLGEIGQLFGHRYHGTVLHAVKRVQNECDTNPQFAAQFNSLKEALK